MANCPPLVFYGPLAIAPPPGLSWHQSSFIGQALSCHHWPSWPISISPTHRPLSLFLGHLGPLWPLWPVGQSGPFWPNPMRPKGSKGDNPLALKARWVPNHSCAHLHPILSTITMTPKMATNHQRPQIGQEPPWTTFQPMASGNHQISSAQSFPSNKGGFFPFLHTPRTQGCRSGA
ncbi:hypothetical protein O181_107802 [Austropuccinia psidii MF-1]|uniref:Uncharacterized protein n=1 Tax=Austropuccinia psidii MF-1 TaxID=1389203 RepID=A0A9Q3PPS0_9BASI|nr:hypothetical protein [Austropuccinia psidii MF-1]